MKQYKFPENNLGYKRIKIADTDNIKFTNENSSKEVIIYQSTYSRKINENEFHAKLGHKEIDITKLIESPEDLEKVQESPSIYTRYYKFPENIFGFVNIGIRDCDGYIYLNHCSGGFVVIHLDNIWIER